MKGIKFIVYIFFNWLTISVVLKQKPSTMKQNNYIIEYTAKAKNGEILKSGKVKAKNKNSSIDAQVKFEAFLRKKYPDFGQLIVHKCTEENPFHSMFGDLMGDSDPFGL